MFCPKCGNEIISGGTFCGSCGTKIEVQQQNAAPPHAAQNYNYQMPQNNNFTAYSASPQEIAEAEGLSKTSLIQGILSLALCWLLGVPGIILGALAISNGKKSRLVLNESHYYYWNALAGVITGSIGLALSIFFTVYYFLIFVLVSSMS